MKDLGKGQRQGQAWHVAIAFDRVDALTRDAYGLCKLLLGPPPGHAKLFYSIDEGWTHVKQPFHLIIKKVGGCVK